MKIDCDSSLLQCANCTSPIMHLICPSSPPPPTPPPPPKNCITLVFHFSWYYSRLKRNWKQCLWEILGTNKVHYGRCASWTMIKVYVIVLLTSADINTFSNISLCLVSFHRKENTWFFAEGALCYNTRMQCQMLTSWNFWSA